MTETRERFISAATKAFAERGFYGTSIAAIADALPYTKQALLHHFGSKEKLYAEVLKRISDRLMAELEGVRERALDPRDRLEETFVEFYRTTIERPDDTQLLMRELLDNKRRAETSRTWYLKPFLESLVDMVVEEPSTNTRSRHVALAVVYQLLGAINYFAVSEPTLKRMFGGEEFSKLRGNYEAELRRLIAARLDSEQ
ncbi:MAG: TetR/AcrR family transcriptional regulator [Woeseiaceae bacterium]|nr:TetR/AcrR family transcriptional regulator [Woeseiaceae bacterium]